MRVLYFDAFSGISGDMTVGALLALGVRWEELRQALTALPLPHFEVHSFPKRVHSIEARAFAVEVPPHAHLPGSSHPHRRWQDIRALLEGAPLDAPVRERALDIFHRLAEAEGKVHGVPAHDVTFHEVGAVDSIVDIVAVSVGLVALGVERAYVSELPLGRGLVHGQHGPIPVPGPATLELLRGYRARFEDGDAELVTPTGAAIVASVARPQPPPPLRPIAVGYGAGQRELPDRPNVLRLVLAEEQSRARREEMFVVETNLDDFSPQWFEWVVERLFAVGARDVWLTPVHMKKSRPGFVLSALADATARTVVAETLLEESSTLGVRTYAVERCVLPREEASVATRFGDVRVKLARTPAGRLRVVPEYEDCRRAAAAAKLPLSVVYSEVDAAVRQRWPEASTGQH